jgi:hypothetical protein
VKNLAADSDVFRGLDGHHKMAAIELGLVEQVKKLARADEVIE